MHKKIMKQSILISMVTFTLLFLTAFTSFRGDFSAENVNVTNVKTPISETKSGMKWSHSFSTKGLTYNSTPIFTEEGIYIVSKNTLYLLSYDTGVTLNELTLCASMNSVCNMLLEDNYLYIPLANGIVECIDLATFSSMWSSNKLQGQALSTLYSYKGKLYGGCTQVKSDNTTEGIFYCLDQHTGNTIWTYENKDGGYYWSGAYVYNDQLYITGDDGKLMLHSLDTDEIIDSKPLTSSKIRSGFTYDKETSALYTMSNTAELIKIPVGENSEEIQKISLTATKNVNCTSTPTIYNGKLYVGSIQDLYGTLSVVNLSTMKVIYQAKGPRLGEIKSSPLVSTAYDDIYVYFCCNTIPGGLYYMKDSATATSGTIETLFIPEKNQQYCMSSVSVDQNGVLYYSNDSGTLFAIEIQPYKKPAAPAIEKPAAESSSNVTITKKPTVAKPTKLKIKKTKKGYKISWKRVKQSTTFLYLKKGKKKWKKIKSTTKNTYVLSKKKKGYKLRLRNGIKKNKTWYYSSYTNYKKLK